MAAPPQLLSLLALQRAQPREQGGFMALKSQELQHRRTLVLVQLLP